MDKTTLEEQARRIDDLMTRLQRVMQVQSIFKNFNVTSTQAFILRHLIRCGESKASHLAKVSGLSPGAVTQVCDELVRTGLVLRSRSDDDRRVVHIGITDEGRTLMEQISDQRCTKMDFILQQLGEHDAVEFVRIVERVVDIMENYNTEDVKS